MGGQDVDDLIPGNGKLVYASSSETSLIKNFIGRFIRVFIYTSLGFVVCYFFVKVKPPEVIREVHIPSCGCSCEVPK